MTMPKRGFLGGAAGLAALPSARAQTAHAQTGAAPLRIGILTDMSGPFSANTGMTSVLSARLAIEDFGPSALGRPIELLSADHQNRPEVALTIARKWFDQDGVDSSPT